MSNTVSQPTVLKILKGNPGKRKLNTFEPKPVVKFPDPPKSLTGPALEHYRELGAMLERIGLLTEADGESLGQYCDLYEAYWELSKSRNQNGTMRTDENGELQPAPEITKMALLADKLLRLQIQFGMTPSARSSLKVFDKKSPEDDLLAFANRNRGRPGKGKTA